MPNVIKIARVPSMIMIAAGVAPLVARGIITNREGRMLVERRYQQAAAAIANDQA